MASDGGGSGDGEPTQVNSIRRRLQFDDIDGENVQFNLSENQNQVFVELARQLDEARERWNFDFRNEIPLPGRWEWTRVEDATIGLILPADNNSVPTSENEVIQDVTESDTVEDNTTTTKANEEVEPER